MKLKDQMSSVTAKIVLLDHNEVKEVSLVA